MSVAIRTASEHPVRLTISGLEDVELIIFNRGTPSPACLENGSRAEIAPSGSSL